MKPLNLDNSPCSPISSNCVIWQGPSIPCIKLCTGDTITDVVYALAIKLCNIVDAVNISTLDLSCLDITTGTPSNINDLLQILIDKICTLNNVPSPSVFPTPGNTSCPTNCIVPVAECLQTNGQTTMKLLDYVQLIGNTICDILDDITIINSSITNLTIRVTALESIPPTPPYILPSVVPDCTLADGSVIGGISYPLNIILTALVNDDNHGYCALLSQLGQPNEINVAYNSQSVDGTEGSLSNCALTLDQLFSVTWISAPTNLSESFIDLWLVVQDIRDAYKRYNVTAGNSNVTVTTTTTPDSCGPEVSFAITAKSSSVLPGDNITSVTTNVVGYDTEYTVNAKGLTVTDSSSIAFNLTTVGDNWNIKAQIVDTGWVNLEGFSWFLYTAQTPQCRRIGNIVYFRGALMVPLDNSGSLVNYNYGGLSGTDTYGPITSVSPWQGAEGVLINTAGSLTFNENNIVIPTSVVGISENFDKTVQSNWILGTRMIRSKVPPTTRTETTVTGIPTPSSFSYVERYVFSETYTNIACIGGTGTGLIINFTTNASGEISSISIVNPGVGYTALDTVTLPVLVTTTSGIGPVLFLTITTTTNIVPSLAYSSVLHVVSRIQITDDKKIKLILLRDFEENASSATGVPTADSSYNTSMLNILQAPVKVDEYVPYFRRDVSPNDITLGSAPDYGIQNTAMRYSYLQMTAGTNNIGVYPFSCDPNDPQQLGGFGWMQLDGMMAYLDPCNTDLKGNPC